MFKIITLRTLAGLILVSMAPITYATIAMAADNGHSGAYRTAQVNPPENMDLQPISNSQVQNQNASTMAPCAYSNSTTPCPAYRAAHERGRVPHHARGGRHGGWGGWYHGNARAPNNGWGWGCGW